ncbi:MAG TPA: maleylpyruvate isomerase family mycothiol-dependent enzyme [Acidimicrobiia bacterium]|nr:maleylpyruvate isomerase family mycothiol-dependent enzyme [Acidimicrobiia bacterium]
MHSIENLDVIRSEGGRILELARRDPDRVVPQYPDWTMAGLLSHIGGILGRTTLICRELPTERISAPRPSEGADVLDWYEAILAEMLTTLEESDPDTPVWGFWPGPCIGLWERRMVIEAGVHRWDAEQAFGEPEPLLDLVAVSGLDEFTDMWVPRMGEVPALEVKALDLGRDWLLGTGTPEASVSGTASDLYLRLMARASAVELPQEWAAAVDALEPPPR